MNAEKLKKILLYLLLFLAASAFITGVLLAIDAYDSPDPSSFWRDNQ